MRENTSVHRLLRRVLSLCLAVVLAVSLCVPALAAQKKYSASDYVQRLKDSVRGSATVDLDAGKDPNEVVRAMVVTDVPAAVEQGGNADYTAAVQSAESKALRSQESIIRQARRITGNAVINQSGYLVSAFSMNMTRSQMKQVAALDGVVSVTVPAGGTAQVTGILTIPASAAKNHFVEAFVSLEGDVDLSVPVMGFYGDWYGSERIVDLPAWDEDNILTNYYENLPVTTVAAGGSYAGYDTENLTTDPQHIAFSPNGDGDFDTAQPILGLLRSSQEITVDVLDENGQVVRQINHRENVAKTLAMDANESRSPITLQQRVRL